jgi:DNA-binding response OmpR family regulator
MGMQSQNIKVMAVDDDDINLEILIKNLSDSGYKTIGYKDGADAWKHMNSNPDSVDIVLLDKMMPNMSGLEVLAKMRSHNMLKNVPVIIQTGDVGINEVKEGLEAGAYYYLCKPFETEIMIAMVNAAARDFVQKNAVYKKLRHENTLAYMISEGNFSFRTVDEAVRLAGALSHNAQNPDRINTALLELMVNAIEHGNLNIGHEEKGRLLSCNKLDFEIERRLNLPENFEKTVSVNVKNLNSQLEVTIADAGKGFPWHKYMDFDPLRLTEPNGRGIATANLMGSNVSYIEPGNKVVCSFKTVF